MKNRIYAQNYIISQLGSQTFHLERIELLMLTEEITTKQNNLDVLCTVNRLSPKQKYDIL